MNFPLLPTALAKSLTDIPESWLREQGIRLLMLDFDNTIVPYTTSVPTEEMSRWLAGMRRSGIRLCVVSNSRKARVQVFCRKYGLDCVTHAGKPFPRGIRRCLAQYGEEPAASALVGDQIFTDTLGANCMGVRSILVPAIDNHNIWLKLRHVAELPFIFAARKRRIAP